MASNASRASRTQCCAAAAGGAMSSARQRRIRSSAARATSRAGAYGDRPTCWAVVPPRTRSVRSSRVAVGEHQRSLVQPGQRGAQCQDPQRGRPRSAQASSRSRTVARCCVPVPGAQASAATVRSALAARSASVAGTNRFAHGAVQSIHSGHVGGGQPGHPHHVDDAGPQVAGVAGGSLARASAALSRTEYCVVGSGREKYADRALGSGRGWRAGHGCPGLAPGSAPSAGHGSSRTSASHSAW